MKPAPHILGAPTRPISLWVIAKNQLLMAAKAKKRAVVHGHMLAAGNVLWHLRYRLGAPAFEVSIQREGLSPEGVALAMHATQSYRVTAVAMEAAG